MPRDEYWWVSYKGAPAEIAQIKVKEGKTYLMWLNTCQFKIIDENWHLIRAANASGHFCEDCVHVTRPKGGACGTLVRRLREMVSEKGKPFIPIHVVPAMIEIEAGCMRFKKK